MEALKAELVNRIDNLTELNVLDTKIEINKLFDFILLSQTIWGNVPEFKMPLKKVESDIVDLEVIPPKTAISLVEQEADIIKEEYIEELNKALPLARRLKGGILAYKTGTRFVPEKIIRMNNWVHGDYIKAVGDEETALTFEKLADSTTAQESLRIELDYCLVIKKDGVFCIEQYIHEGALQPTLLNGEPHAFILNESNTTSARIEEGGLVVIAYYANRPHEFRVIWSYPMSVMDSIIKPKPSGYYKDGNLDKKETWTIEEREMIKKKKIVIIGAEFRAKDFKALIKDAELDCRVLEGTESMARFEAAVRGKDLIITLSSHGRHRSSELAKELAKKYEIPFRAAPTSLSSVKKAIYHGITEPQISFHSLF